MYHNILQFEFFTIITNLVDLHKKEGYADFFFAQVCSVKNVLIAENEITLSLVRYFNKIIVS